MGGKGKKRDETGRKSAREASRVVDWGGGGKAVELRNPHPSPDSLARFTGRFFFAFPLTSEPGPRLL